MENDIENNQIPEEQKKPPVILIVDDDAIVGETCQVFLNKEGFKAYKALSAEDAIEIIKSKHIDVVMRCCGRSWLSGLELTKIIKRKYDSDVIIFTGYEKNCNHEQAVNIGAADFFYKPFKLVDMLSSVKRILQKRLQK